MMEAPSFLREGGGELEEGSADFFAQIDDLLDFSDVDEVGMTDEARDGSWDSTATAGTCSELMAGSSDGKGSSDLCVPSEEEAAHLEWLSIFMEDSFCRPSSEFSSAAITTNIPKTGRLLVSSPTSVLEQRVLPCPKFCARSRTRRSRRPVTAVPWTCLPIISEKPSECSSEKPVVKRKWPEGGRKCMHCSIEKTPQWRTGPFGPKTLCNACGVRYKSGRLLPEYRPAASPTFVPWKHSNSHRKVMEMRNKKARIGEEGAANADDDGGPSR